MTENLPCVSSLLEIAKDAIKKKTAVLWLVVPIFKLRKVDRNRVGCPYHIQIAERKSQ